MRLLNVIFISVFLFGLLTKISAQKIARVVRVKDGDTFILKNGNNVFTARLNKIDAPEIKQNGGLQSYQKLNELIIGRELNYDSTGKDFYGRILINAFIDNKRLDSLIIRNGWAWHYNNYDKEPLLDSAMNKAISERLGVWACGVSKVCPPWLWRRYSYRNRARFCKGCRN